MHVTEVLGNALTNPELIDSHAVTRVSLTEEQQLKRVQRLSTPLGDVAVQLPAGSPALADGDILALTDDQVLVVAAAPTDVITILPRTVLEMGVTAHNLGNRHMPAQFFELETGEIAMFVRSDTTVIDYLEHVGVPYRREERVMPKPFRHAEHTH